jgi:putative oxidoreductase
MNTQSASELKNLIQKSTCLTHTIEMTMERLSPFGDLLLRGWVAYAFWVSGLIKVKNWESTLYLFQSEYSVPFLSPEIAAMLGSGVELCCPVLLALGLFGRSTAALQRCCFCLISLQ